MQTYRDVRFSRFIERFKDTTIENYFDINNNTKNDEEKVNFCAVISQTTIIFEVFFSKNINKIYNIFQLPDEINREISDYYNTDYLTVKMEISYSEEYPFKPPIWHFVHVKHNIDIPIDLINYYTNIVYFHNSINNKQWSPAIDIHHDILDFIQKINHFDYMLKRENFIF